MQKEPFLGLLLMKTYGALSNAARDPAGARTQVISCVWLQLKVP